MHHGLRRIGRRLGRQADKGVRRVLDAANRRLWNINGKPGIVPGGLWLQAARKVADAVLRLRDYPGLGAYGFSVAGAEVVYVGRPRGLAVITALLGGTCVEAIGSVRSAGIERQARTRLDGGAQLVIIERGGSGGRLTEPGRGEVRFASVPMWLGFSLDIRTPLEELFRGRTYRGIRTRVNTLASEGYTWRFSTSKADFEHFYHEMYLPSLRERHGEAALVTPSDVQYRWWFRAGGLLLVEQNGMPVAGTLTYVAGNRCYGIEAGILNGDPELLRRGVKTYLVHCAIEWAKAQGAEVLDFGGSRPWLCDGALKFKKGWGTVIGPYPGAYSRWHWHFGDVSQELARRINEIGLICESDGGYLRTVVVGEDGSAVGGDPWGPASTPAGLAGECRVAGGSAPPGGSTQAQSIPGRPERRGGSVRVA